MSMPADHPIEPEGRGRSLPPSREQFEREYAERSGMTVEKLREHRTVRSCDCGEDGCEGWQCVSHEVAADIDDPSQPWAR
jgi:hypothetical protein